VNNIDTEQCFFAVKMELVLCDTRRDILYAAWMSVT